MSATDHTIGAKSMRRILFAAAIAGAGVATGMGGVALAEIVGSRDRQVAELLKVRLPKTTVTKVDCAKVDGLCEVTAGQNLFYVDSGSRYLVIGRVYDMQTRQDLTAARLLEINPDMLVGGAARANAAAEDGGEEPGVGIVAAPPRAGRPAATARPQTLSLAGLPKDGAIVWGNPTGRTVTVFTDLQCGYCRALTDVLRQLDLRVVERPISVLGSRELSDRVYCAKNKVQALHAAYAGEPLKGGATCDTSGLDANEAFARRHGLSGTPVIVRDDGAVLEGYRPKEFLQSWLREARS